MYLSHLESLVKTTKPYPQFEEVCSLYSLLLIDTKEEKNSKKKKRIFYTFCENPQLSLSSAPQADDHVCIVGAGPAGYFARETLEDLKILLRLKEYNQFQRNPHGAVSEG